MSLWVSEEVIKGALRFCSCRFLWQQHILVKTTSIKNTFFPCQQLGHIWDARQSQTCMARSFVSSVRFYSQGRIYSDELEEKEHLSSAQTESSPLAEIQSRKYPFTDQLQRCCSPSDVLELTCKYVPNTGQVSNCLNHMWSTTKKMSEEQRLYELQLMFEHPAFDKLLKKAMKSARHMHRENLVYTLLSMVKLGVPQQSHVVHTFLRSCQVNNELTLTARNDVFIKAIFKYCC